MKILLATFGTYGDVHPFIGLGRQLALRGNDVRVITSPFFDRQVRDAGLEIAPVGSAEDFSTFINDIGLWEPKRSFQALFERAVVPLLRPVYQGIVDRYVPGQTVVVASTLCLGARLAQDKHGIPTATMHVYPRPLTWLTSAPPENDEANFRFASPINRVRSELDLPPVWWIRSRWWNSPLRVIAAFPPWFAPPPANLPAHVRFGTFPLYDAGENQHIPEALARFLQAGDAPIAFVPGSAGWHRSAFAEAAIDACRITGRRGILLGRDVLATGASLPESMFACDYAPFSRLFPHCRAVVHQGAIGTAALAMAAGKPQVSVPVSLDQPDNAEKLKRLGIARTVAADQLSGGAVATALDALLGDSKTAQRCQTIAARLRRDDHAISRMCALVEELVRHQAPPPVRHTSRASTTTVNLISVGTYGDVHPYVGIARALRARGGRRVRLIASPYYRNLIESAGIEHVPLGTVQDYHDLVKDASLWAARDGRQYAAQMCLRMTRAEHDAVHAAQRDDPHALFLASNFCLGARVAQERLGIETFATLHIAPYSFYHADIPPEVDRELDALILPSLNNVRGEIGLPPVREALRQWWESPRCVIGLFPEWFAPAQAGWPAQTQLVGFPLYDEGEQHEPSEALERFLASGPPPVAFTPGSGMWHGEEFFRESVQACRTGDFRGILLTRRQEHLPSELPPTVIHVDYAPFGRLLPRCAAIVHHAGIGTTAQALAAGIPQLLMPMAHDQPYNASCVLRLGVGAKLSPGEYRAPAVAAALQALISDAHVPARAQRIVDTFRYTRAVDHACEIVEGMR